MAEATRMKDLVADLKQVTDIVSKHDSATTPHDSATIDTHRGYSSILPMHTQYYHPFRGLSYHKHPDWSFVVKNPIVTGEVGFSKI